MKGSKMTLFRSFPPPRFASSAVVKLGRLISVLSSHSTKGLSWMCDEEAKFVLSSLRPRTKQRCWERSGETTLPPACPCLDSSGPLLSALAVVGAPNQPHQLRSALAHNSQGFSVGEKVSQEFTPKPTDSCVQGATLLGFRGSCRWEPNAHLRGERPQRNFEPPDKTLSECSGWRICQIFKAAATEGASAAAAAAA